MNRYKGIEMYIDRFIFPVTSLGPGNRLCIWVAGCKARCRGCANPELWTQNTSQYIKVNDLVSSIHKFLNGKQIDGITITGGEPFDQALEVAEMLDLLRVKSDILVFSGYSIDEIEKDICKKVLLDKIDVLIDGRYVEELNDGKAGLRGSVNQQIHVFNNTIKGKYDDYVKAGRQIQNFVYDYNTISVGIHMNDR